MTSHRFPYLPSLWLLISLLFLPGVLEPSFGADESKKEKPSTAAKAKGKAKGETEGKGVAGEDDPARPLTKPELRMKRFSRLPVGATSLGIVRPIYKNVEISSLMTADVITRVDLETIRIDNLVITIYSEQVPGLVERVITMKVAFYHIPTLVGESDVLSSPTPSMIEVVGKYYIVGESVIYDPDQGLARMDGAVRAVFDYKAMNASGEDEEKKTKAGKDDAKGGAGAKNKEKAIEPGTAGGEPDSPGATGSVAGESRTRGSGTQPSSTRP